MISNDIKWNCHISEIVKKAATRLYFLGQLFTSPVFTRLQNTLVPYFMMDYPGIYLMT